MAIQRKWLVIHYTSGESGRPQYSWFRTRGSAHRAYLNARAAGYYACFPVWKP